MNRKVKRYDPINSDGTCGMCVEDVDYGAYVEFADYAAIETECNALRVENDRLRAAEKDAARYRWLRAGCDHKTSTATHIASSCYGLEWDAAIDTAMKGSSND